MAKIGMLTFYDVKNYGAALQAFALQSTVVSMGHDAEFIRYYEKKGEGSSKLGTKDYFRVLKNNDYSIKTYLTMRTIEHNKYDRFNEFCERYMKTSQKTYYNVEELRENEYLYDGFVTGSDMVWSDIGQNLDVYFLNFAPKNKRLSYAPSLTGREKENVEETNKYKNWLNGISALSCREQYGVDYVKKITGKDAALVLDPTLLLQKEQWIEQMNLKQNNSCKDYILCYMFGGVSKTLKKKLEHIKRKLGVKVRYIPISTFEVKEELSNGYVPNYGPKEFVELFFNAKFVLTNSYHGLLFSLIMNKPFLLFHRGKGNEWSRYEERMNNILHIIDQEERYIFEKDLNVDILSKIDYEKVNSIIESTRRESIEYLIEALKLLENSEKVYRKNNQKKNRLNRIDELEENSCTGCGVCFNICPADCISMRKNREGFLYPYVDNSKCIECGKCVAKCQAVTEGEIKNYPRKTFYGYGNGDFIKNSASGGAFVTFARWIIQQKGVVYGAVLDLKTGTCYHKGVDNIEDLQALQNSKYVQSDICNVMKECKKELEEGKWVLFSGTPCQVVALKNHLSSKYERLITVDLICHGVPSPAFFEKYLKNEIGLPLKRFKFRHKLDVKKRRSAFDIVYEKNEEGHKIISGSKDLYYKLFLNGQSYRESCYICKFADDSRVGDITIGDCDSWKKTSKFGDEIVVSTILINTDLGENFWRVVQDDFTYDKLDYEEECISNHQLRRPVVRPSIREKLYDDIEKLSWKEIVKKYGDNRLKGNVVKIMLKLFKSKEL